MTTQLVLTVLGAAALVSGLAAWVAGLLYVRWDTRRRGLPGWQRALWTAAALWPLAGFTLYVLLAARAAQTAGARGQIQPFSLDLDHLPDRSARRLAPRRVTQPRPPANWQRRSATQPVAQAQRDQPLIPTTPVSAVSRTAAPGSGAAEVAAAPAFCLSALEGPHTGQDFELRELPARIGRGPEAAIRLDADLGVSRRHAEFYKQGGVLRLRDTNSAHGTTVNGYTITDKGLAPGDRIRIGHSLLQLKHLGGSQS